jgi:hypothetical protein
LKPISRTTVTSIQNVKEKTKQRKGEFCQKCKKMSILVGDSMMDGS